MGHKYADLQGDACMSELESLLPTSESGVVSKGPTCKHSDSPISQPFLLAPYRIEQYCQKELSTSDAPVQFTRASRIFIIEDCVSEEATCLPWQHLEGKEIGRDEI